MRKLNNNSNKMAESGRELLDVISAIASLINKGSISVSEQIVCRAMVMATGGNDPISKAAVKFYEALSVNQSTKRKSAEQVTSPKPEKPTYASAVVKAEQVKSPTVSSFLTKSWADEVEEEEKVVKPAEKSVEKSAEKSADKSVEKPEVKIAQPSLSQYLVTGKYYHLAGNVPGIGDRHLTQRYYDSVNRLYELITKVGDRFVDNTGRADTKTILVKTSMIRNGSFEINIAGAEHPNYERKRDVLPLKDFIGEGVLLNPYTMTWTHPNFSSKHPFRQICYSSGLVAYCIDADRVELLIKILKLSLSKSPNEADMASYNIPKDVKADDLIEYANYHMLIELVRAVQTFEISRMMMIRSCEFIVCFGDLLSKEFLGHYGYDTSKLMKYATDFLAREGIKRT